MTDKMDYRNIIDVKKQRDCSYKFFEWSNLDVSIVEQLLKQSDKVKTFKRIRATLEKEFGS